MICKNHKNEIAIEKCSSCGHWYCDECVTVVDNKAICNHCSGKKTPIIGNGLKENIIKGKKKYTEVNIDDNIKKPYWDDDYLKKHKDKTLSDQKAIVKETQDGIKAYKNSKGATTVNPVEQSFTIRKQKINNKLVLSAFFCLIPRVQFFGFILLIVTIVDYIGYSNDLKRYNGNLNK